MKSSLLVSPGPHGGRGGRGEGAAYGWSGIREQKAGRNHEQQWSADRSLDVSWPQRISDGSMDDRQSPSRQTSAAPTGIRDSMYRYVRTSQDCGSSTAQSP